MQSVAVAVDAVRAALNEAKSWGYFLSVSSVLFLILHGHLSEIINMMDGWIDEL